MPGLPPGDEGALGRAVHDRRDGVGAANAIEMIAEHEKASPVCRRFPYLAPVREIRQTLRQRGQWCSQHIASTLSQAPCKAKAFSYLLKLDAVICA